MHWKQHLINLLMMARWPLAVTTLCPLAWGQIQEQPRDTSTTSAATQHAVSTVNTIVQQRYSYAMRLAERGAFFSAQAELKQALWVIANASDLAAGGTLCQDALDAGLQALAEADDFAPFFGPNASNLKLARVAAAHHTPIACEEETGRTAYAVMQEYLRFAEESLVSALSDEPAASQLLFGLAKIQGASGKQAKTTTAKSIVLFRAALAIDPANAAAANELAVLLSRVGHLQDAREILAHAVSPESPRELWQNLSKIHSKLGEPELAERAEKALAVATPHQSPAVQWVSPTQFTGQVEPGVTIGRSPLGPKPELTEAAVPVERHHPHFPGRKNYFREIAPVSQKLSTKQWPQLGLLPRTTSSRSD